MAQDTLEIQDFKTVFQKNIDESTELECQSDSWNTRAEIESIPVLNFEKSLKSIELSIFKNPVEISEDFFLYLNDLTNEEKEKLVRNFSTTDNYFSEALARVGLPTELKYMAPAVSSMNRNAVGNDGRAGLWQLTHFQGILNGLTINRLIDERLNERISIQAYIREINQNREIFGSIELAVLAQWYGRTKVQNVLAFAKDQNSADKLLRYFPQNVYEKIAAFQAMALFLNQNWIIELRGDLSKNIAADTVTVFNQLHFKQVSQVLNIPEEQLICLNPQYRFSIIPESKNGNELVIPNGYHDEFLAMQDSIFNALDSSLFEIIVQKIEYPPTPTRQYLGEPVKDLEIEGKTKIKYRLKTGDVLGIIAEKYDVRIEDLKYWNNIVNERRIQAGNYIDIFVDDDQVDYYLNIDEEEMEEISDSNSLVEQLQQSATLKILEDLKDTPKIEYEVKSGESPYTIAKKFDGVTPDEILIWNNINDARKIQVGQKLIIYLKN